MADQKIYSVAEVSKATGIKDTIVYYRRKVLGIAPGRMSYEDVKAIVGYKYRGNGGAPRKNVIDKLRLQLKNDGYKVSD